MTYLKDSLTDAIRCFDEKTPKEERKIKAFLKAREYGVDDDNNTIESVGRRWSKTTKAEYDKYIKTTV